MSNDEIRDFAAELYRREHPKQCPTNPYERQIELGDLWPISQQEYIERSALALKLAAQRC